LAPHSNAPSEQGKAKILGAMYDVSTGKVSWLASKKMDEILERVESSPDKETEPFADE